MKYHPDIELLLKYSSGQIEPSLSVAIAIHQKDCEVCQLRISEFEAVGGDTLEHSPELNISKPSVVMADFDKLFTDIESLPEESLKSDYDNLAVAQSDIPLIDQLNNGRFEEINWQRVSPKIWRASIAMNDPSFEVIIKVFG